MREQADEELGFMQQLSKLDFGSTLGEFVQVAVCAFLRHSDLNSAWARLNNHSGFENRSQRRLRPPGFHVMRIEKNGQMITSVEDWERFAPPKSPHQWVVGRSAFELARAWCHTGSPAAPNEMRALFETLADTRGLVIDCVMPELQIRFDAHRGEPRNADLAFIGNTANARWAVTVEAKADEPFGATVAETAADALERSIENSRSKGLQRVGDLVRALFHPRTNGAPEAGSLRYQLLTASAGSLAFAVQEQASSAILIVHEFMTDKTNDVRHTKNGADYRAFLHRLAGHPVVDDQTALHGPFTVPGTPLFEKPPRLFVGKIVTNRRTANDREAHG